MDKLRTVVARFIDGKLPAWVTNATFKGEPKGRPGMARVVASFEVIENPGLRLNVPMTPVEARNLSAWLSIQADHADYLNEGIAESTALRVLHPSDS